MNKEAMRYYGVTLEDYKKWCEENGLKHYDKDSKKKYFDYLNKKEAEKLNSLYKEEMWSEANNED